MRARLWVASVCSACVVSVLRIVLVPVVQSIVVVVTSSIYGVEFKCQLFVVYLSLKGWRWVPFQFLVRVLIVNEFIHLVVVVLVHDQSFSVASVLVFRLSLSYYRLWRLFVG